MLQEIVMRALAGALLVLGLAGAVGCGGAESPQGDGRTTSKPTAPCVPPSAPFGKVMNAATSVEFTRCLVKTEAEFLSPDWGVVVGGDVAGHVKWSATVPGSVPGATDLKFMLIPKSASDPVFTLKKGERIEVTGWTATTDAGQVLFFTTDVRKAAPAPAP